MLKLGIIEVGESDYMSPMILVEVAGKEPRPCIDYRKLNEIIRTEYFPLSNIEERVERVSAAKFITGFRTPSEIKVQAVPEFPTPRTKTQIRSFLGLAGYYQKYINLFSVIDVPLTDALKGRAKKGEITWTTECENAFRELKRKLIDKSVLYAPNFEREFIVKTDASNAGMGAVLTQLNEQGEEHPILYLSKKFSEVEKRYCTTEKECASIVFAIKRLHYYLDGNSFLVMTDHNPLVWLNRNVSSNPRLMRWALALQPYNFRIVHLSVQVLSATCNSSALPNGVNIIGPCSHQISDVCNAHCVHNGQVLWREKAKCLSGDQWSPLPPCNATNSLELIRCDILTNVSQENLSPCIKIKITLRGSTSAPKAMCPEILRLFMKFGKCITEPGGNCTVSCPYGGFVLQCATSKQENCIFSVPLCPELKSMKLINCSRGVGEFCKVSLNTFLNILWIP
ncbi:retrovirus-related Pol polyprotein from transposon 297 [Trichonephila clavipes]|nr:retrovirus-related Pol polyprotein from transposon 297 [Trichonephila clavipes]